MDLEELKNASQDPDLIPGIYNYCDRWCERCYLSSRCLTFKMEMRENRSEASKDLQNKEFWDELADIFALTMEMLYEMAKEEGVDLNAIDTEDIKYPKVDDAEVKHHPVSIAAEKYFKSSRSWLDDYFEVFQEKTNEYKELAEKEINQAKNTNNLLVLNDLYDIISWYHTMIPVKSKRAVMSSLDDWEMDEIQMI